MEKVRKILVLLAAVCLMMTLAACKTQTAESDSDTQTQTLAELPQTAKSEEGIVLDVSDGQFILRTVGGMEYVFRMHHAEDLTPDGTKPGQMVRAWYDGVLTGTNAANVKLLRIEPIDEIVYDELSENSVVHGIITAADEQTVTIRTKDGQEHLFTATEAMRSIPDGAKAGQWVRIVFDGSLKMPVVKNVTLLAEEAESYILTGAVSSYSEEKKTIEIQSDAGGVYTFLFDNADMSFPNGVKRWSRVDLTYTGHAQAKNAENKNAVLIAARPASKAKPHQITVTVQNVTKNRGNIDVVTADGRVLRFYVDAKLTSGANALAAGDSIRINYTGCIAEEKTGSAQIVSVEKLSSDVKKVFGTVRSAENEELVLDTNDGRTLTLKMKEGKELPKELETGLSVCVRYDGVIVHDDAQNAHIESISYFYE